MRDKETKLSLQKNLINALSVLKNYLIFEDTAFYCFYHRIMPSRTEYI